MIITATTEARQHRLTAPLWEADIIAVPVKRVVGSETTAQITDLDAVVNRTSSPEVVTDYRLQYQGMEAVIGWESRTPAICSVDSDGNAAHIAPGAGVIAALFGDGERLLFLDFTVEESFVDKLVNYVSGSLALHCSTQVDDLVAGKTAAAGPMYSTRDDATPAYVRNAGVWTGEIDLTCIAVWNSRQGERRAATLVTPRDVLMAGHYEIRPGDTVRFVQNDGTVVTRTMQSIRFYTEAGGTLPWPGSDLCIGRLSEAVPEGITPCKVLPDNWDEHLPVINPRRSVPGLSSNQKRDAVCKGISDVFFNNAAATGPSGIPARDLFHKPSVTGDSGNPVFLLINGEPVLAIILASGGPGGGGPFVAHSRAVINAGIAQMGGSATLTQADLSGFTNYG